MTKITKNGLIRNQTELTMYRHLHADVNEWKQMYTFMYRRTNTALAGVERWVESGVLETSQRPVHPGTSYTQEMYRLRPQYRDHSLIATDFAEREGRLAEREIRNRTMLESSQTLLTEAYASMQDVMMHTATYSDDALEHLSDVTGNLQRALIQRRSALAEEAAINDARTALDGDIAAQPDIYAVAGDGDPLGGDA